MKIYEFEIKTIEKDRHQILLKFNNYNYLYEFLKKYEITVKPVIYEIDRLLLISDNFKDLKELFEIILEWSQSE